MAGVRTESTVSPPHDRDLTVSVVSANNRAQLEACLRAIVNHTSGIALELYVVDNASTDGTDELLKREFPNVQVIHNPQRLGFAASHNRALERGRGDTSLILNDDTVILPGCFETMVRFMDAHPKAGACGPRLLNGDGSLQRTANRFPTLLFGIFEALSLNRIFPNDPVQRQNLYAEWDRTTTRQVDAVSGAALLIRASAMAQIGLLDPNFFIYSEEIDWCYRLHQRGWQVYYLPDARITHFGGQSTATRAPQKFHDIHWASFLLLLSKTFRQSPRILCSAPFMAHG